MRNINGGYIVRVMDKGKRVGAVVYQQGQPVLVLQENEIKQFSHYLQHSRQRLENARITADGRIVPITGRQVEDKDKSFYGKAFDAFYKTVPSVQTAQPTKPTTQQPYVITPAKLTTPQPAPKVPAAPLPQPKPPSPTQDKLREAGIGLYIGTTEDRLLSAIIAGLDLARASGIDYIITNAKNNPAYSGRRTFYLRVDVASNALSSKYCPLIFNAYVDGVIEINAPWADADPLAFEYQGETIYCHNAVDIRDALCWLLHNCGNGSEYGKHKHITDTLIAESKNRANDKNKKAYPVLKLPHIRFDAKLSTHIRDLEQIKRYLNEKFAGTYVFIWVLQNNDAVLTVRKYAKDTNSVSDALLEIRLQLYTANRENCVRLAYKTASTFALQGSNRWICLQEFQHIKYLDTLGDAVQSIIDSVFSSGAFREAYDVISRGVLDGVPHYLLRGKQEPLSEQVLLGIAEQGKVVNGVCFEIGQNNALAVVRPGLNRYGHKLAEFAKLKDGNYYLRIPFAFHDTQQDKEVTVNAAVPWELYYGLATAPRSTNAALQHPTPYVKAMLIQPQAQQGILTSLGSELKTIAEQRGYYDEQKARLLLDFMACCRFVHLADALHGNRTAVETLVERAGCCIEQSLLAAMLARFLGLPASVLFRYSPYLTTRFHAVAGVGLLNYNNTDAAEYCRNNKDFTCVDMGGYIGLEVSNSKGKPVGVAEYWKTASGDNLLSAPKQPCQVICVPVSSDLTHINSYIQVKNAIGIKQMSLLTQEGWQYVIKMFSDKA